ncbi:MAG: hypothetical protein WD534_15450 [Phycisphaeraceae bacterium]
MTPRPSLLAMMVIAMLPAALPTAIVRGAEPSDDERQALAELAAEIDGAVVYTRDKRVRRVRIGEWKPEDLGAGEYARWSPDGRHLAVYHDGRVFVMQADGSERRALAKGDHADGCPIEFHANNRQVIYWKKESGFHVVDIETGESETLDLPGVYSGEPGISADGKRLAARWGNRLYAIDLEAGTHDQYARGCSAGVSPDGTRLMNNVGSHRQLEIHQWDDSDRMTLDTRDARPDRQWDNHHWSNHDDYLMAQGEGARAEAYVVRISANRPTRVTWEGDVLAPDLHVEQVHEHDDDDELASASSKPREQ